MGEYTLSDSEKVILMARVDKMRLQAQEMYRQIKASASKIVRMEDAKAKPEHISAERFELARLCDERSRLTERANGYIRQLQPEAKEEPAAG